MPVFAFAIRRYVIVLRRLTICEVKLGMVMYDCRLLLHDFLSWLFYWFVNVWMTSFVVFFLLDAGLWAAFVLLNIPCANACKYWVCGECVYPIQLNATVEQKWPKITQEMNSSASDWKTCPLITNWKFSKMLSPGSEFLTPTNGNGITIFWKNFQQFHPFWNSIEIGKLN